MHNKTMSAIVLLLCTFFATNQVNAKEVKIYAFDIVDSLQIANLTVKGALQNFESGLKDKGYPETGKIKECFKRDFDPIARDFYAELYIKSTDLATLKEGADISSRKSIQQVKDFILTSNLAHEAKQNSMRVDVYTFYLASMKADNDKDKTELLAVSNWLKKIAPDFTKEFVSSTASFFKLMNSSVQKCIDETVY